MTVFYMGLESYEERYTLQLEDWNISRFEKRGVPLHVVRGQNLSSDKAIKTGQVLDAHGRSFWSLTQIAELTKLIQEGKVTGSDVIFFEDMFAPGFSALPYIFEQTLKANRPKIFVRCLAQSIDPDDFVFPWRNWMRPYEYMVDEFVDGILMNSAEMGWHCHVGMLNKAPLYVTGLAYDKDEVLSRVPNIKPLSERKKRVAFASRWDKEKQPWFYMDIAEKSGLVDEGVEFAIFTGSKELRSNEPKLVERARELEKKGILKIYEGLTKNQYYELLADSRVHFTCNLQEWVGITINEACTFGTLPLHAAYRAFPDVMQNDERHLYVPWSQNDATAKLKVLLNAEADVNGICEKVASRTHQAIDNTIDILTGNNPERFRYYDR